MNPIMILLPVAAMAILTLMVILMLARKRFRAVKSGEMSGHFYKRYDDGKEPDHIRYVSRNLSNLFETPVLFYTACLVAYISNSVSMALVIIAWIYVLLRVAHTGIHTTSNKVRIRFNLFALSYFFLVAMWIMIAIQLFKQL